MSLQYALPSHGSAAEYQCSGVPYVITLTVASDTVQEIHFPYVSRHFTVIHATTAGSSVRVGFTTHGVNGVEDENYFLLEKGSSSPRLEIKCQKLFIRNDTGSTSNKISVVAGLTNVTQDRFFAVTGSNGVAGVG